MSPSLAELNPSEIADAAASKERKGRAKLRRRLIPAAAIGCAIGLLLAVREVDLPDLSLNLLACLIVAYYLSILFHETGHLLAAVTQHFRIQAFAIRPLMLHREASGWRFRKAPKQSPAGLVAAYPLGNDNLVNRLSIVVGAGPAASLLTALVCSVWAITARASLAVWTLHGLWTLAAVSLLMALPFPSGRNITDWERLRMLHRGGLEGERTMALLLLSTSALQGLRPRDRDAHLMQLAVGPEDGSSDALTGAAMRYSWLLDQRRIDEAEQQLVALLRMPGASFAHWKWHAAFFLSYFRQEAIAARKWRDTEPKPVVAGSRYVQFMAEASIACVENRWTDMDVAVASALNECDRLADAGTVTAIREIIVDLRSRHLQ